MSKLIHLLLVFAYSRVGLGQKYGALPVESVFPWPTTSPSQLSWITDDSWTTSWISSPCRAGSWRDNAEFNLLYSACNGGGMCSGSCSPDLSSATDGSPYTAGTATISQGEGRSWAIFQFPKGKAVAKSIFVRGAWPTNTTVAVIDEAGKHHVIATIGPDKSYLELTFSAPSFPITGVFLQSISKDGVMRGYCYSGIGDCRDITVTEIAVKSQDCYEQITLGLGAYKVVKQVQFLFSGFTGGFIASSLDNRNFINRYSLNTETALRAAKLIDFGNITAKYLRFR